MVGTVWAYLALHEIGKRQAQPLDWLGNVTFAGGLLALMFGLLAGTLNGAAFGNDVVDFNRDFSTVTNTGHMIVAVNIAAFADVPAFRAKVDEIYELMKSSPLLPGFDEIRLPGERSAKIYADRTSNGVPITPELQSTLDQLADRLGIERL